MLFFPSSRLLLPKCVYSSCSAAPDSCKCKYWSSTHYLRSFPNFLQTGQNFYPLGFQLVCCHSKLVCSYGLP
ncbi:unnamed protein product [Cuscuta epithymum]|uniref:Secreted protein n=1 Tax=Cuscuta epithymum TaxID=186058 RepID=A0AAV0DSS2_9ASTE|nr:unnamed protein product [Cuscuta epithymum]